MALVLGAARSGGLHLSPDYESERIRANQARQFMADPLFSEMFDGVESYLQQVALSCDPDNKDRAQRIVISQQLLEALKREIIRRVEDGDMAAFQIKQLEKRKVWEFKR
jgi:hypothetical protein